MTSKVNYISPPGWFLRHSHFSSSFCNWKLCFVFAHTALSFLRSSVDKNLFDKQHVKMYGLTSLIKRTRENKPHWPFYTWNLCATADVVSFLTGLYRSSRGESLCF